MSKIEKLSIALTVKQAESLREAVDAGDFATVSEAAREAVKQWADKRHQERAAALQRVRDLINEGIASGIAPRRRTAREITAEGRRRLALLEAAARPG
jgi:antitoxin ParD1/3/4